MSIIHRALLTLFILCTPACSPSADMPLAADARPLCQRNNSTHLYWIDPHVGLRFAHGNRIENIPVQISATTRVFAANDQLFVYDKLKPQNILIYRGDQYQQTLSGIPHTDVHDVCAGAKYVYLGFVDAGGFQISALAPDQTPLVAEGDFQVIQPLYTRGKIKLLFDNQTLFAWIPAGNQLLLFSEDLQAMETRTVKLPPSLTEFDPALAFRFEQVLNGGKSEADKQAFFATHLNKTLKTAPVEMLMYANEPLLVYHQIVFSGYSNGVLDGRRASKLLRPLRAEPPHTLDGEVIGRWQDGLLVRHFQGSPKQAAFIKQAPVL